MKIIQESLNSFVRNQNPVKSLGLDYEAKIREFFRQYNVYDNIYDIKENGKIIFYEDLYLATKNITELPDNLTINGTLWVPKNIIKLPNKLRVNGHIDLRDTSIAELPNDLIVKGNLFVDEHQLKLVKFIKQSKFKNKIDLDI
jgi:hypothetical protein